MNKVAHRLNTINFLKSVADSHAPQKNEACYKVVVLQLCDLIKELVEEGAHADAAILSHHLSEAARSYAASVDIRVAAGLEEETKLATELLISAQVSNSFQDMLTMSTDIGEA
jgi:hypothetical protein